MGEIFPPNPPSVSTWKDKEPWDLRKEEEKPNLQLLARENAERRIQAFKDRFEEKKLGDRKNQGKLQWNLVDFPSLEPMIRVLMFGAQKYAPHNWKKGLKVTEIIDSLMRHLVALNDGEDNDPESNLPHIGHILCNAMFLSFMLKNREDLDDRHKIDS